MISENCVLRVVKGELGCHGALLTEGREYQIFAKKQNPSFLVENLSEDTLINGSSSLHSSEVAIKSDAVEPIIEYSYDGESEFLVLGYEKRTFKQIQRTESLLEMFSDDKRKLKVVMVAGAKKTGKTTLSHFLANRLLQTSNTKVFYVETDLGQPTYSPPGFISMFEVEDPLLCNKSGWNARYLDYNKLEFVGDNSPQFYPEIYKRGLESLKEELDRVESRLESDAYVVINTHGFTKGIGYFVTKTIMEVLEPDVVAYVATEKAGSDYNLMEQIKKVGSKQLREFRNKISPGDILPFVRFTNILPPEVKNRSRMVKKTRETAFVNFFQNCCKRIEIDIEDVEFYINEEDKHLKVFKRENVGRKGERRASFYLRKRSFDSYKSENLEQRTEEKQEEEQMRLWYLDLSMIFIKSIVHLSTGISSHICLIEDFDIPKKKIQLVIPEVVDIDLASKPRFKITKSPFMSLNANLLPHSNDYDEEISVNGQLGDKLFWVGPNNIGVGEKPAKKIISLRKKLLKG